MRLILFSVACLLLFFAVHDAVATVECDGGTISGKRSYGAYWLRQDEYVQGADSLFFTVSANVTSINAYHLSASKFHNAQNQMTCWFASTTEVRARAGGTGVVTYIPYQDSVKAEATLWVTANPGAIYYPWFSHVGWDPYSPPGLQSSAPETRSDFMPDFHCQLTPESGNQYTFRFTNADDTYAIKVTGLRFAQSQIGYSNLDVVHFGGSASSFELNPGQYWETTITAPSDVYVYVECEIWHTDGMAPVCIYRASGQLGDPEFPIIPSLTGWGMLVLAVLVLASGVWTVMKRRRSARVRV